MRHQQPADWVCFTPNTLVCTAVPTSMSWTLAPDESPKLEEYLSLLVLESAHLLVYRNWDLGNGFLKNRLPRHLKKFWMAVAWWQV